MTTNKPSFQDLEHRIKELEAELAKTQWLHDKENINHREPYSPFYGDVSELNTERTILDTVGKEYLEVLTSELMDLLDTSVAIYEKNGDYAFGVFNSSWCQLMDSASRKICNTNDNKTALNCGKWLCHDDCWNNSAKAAILAKKSTDIFCIGGIKLYAEPIFLRGNVIGVISIGYGNPPTDDKTLMELSEKYSIDLEILRQKAIDYKPRPDFIIEISKKRLKSIAKLIGEIISHKQAKEKAQEREELIKEKNEEYEALNEELREANEHLSAAKEKAEASEKKLNERAKELNGLVSLGLLTDKFENIEDIYNEFIKYIVPNSLQFSDKVYAILEIGGKKYCNNEDYKLTADDKCLISTITIFGKPTGTLTVANIENLPFIEVYEQNLINAFGERISKITERFTLINDLIKAKEQAEKSEENLRFLFENMIQGVVYHKPSGEIIQANEAAATILGLSLDQLYGKTSLDPRWKSIHEDGTEYPGETHPAMITIKTKKPVRNSIMGVFIPNKNDYSWININSIPQLNEKNELIQIVVTFEDITERKKAEEALRNSEAKLSALFASMSEMVVLHELVCSEDGNPVNYRITYCNDAFTKITGISRNDAVGRLSTEVYGTEEPPFLSKYSEVALTGEPCHYETYFQPMDKHFSISVVCFDKNHFATVTSDITLRKNTELMVRQNAHRLKIINDLSQLSDIETDALYNFALEKAIELCNSKIGFLGFLNQNETIVKIHAWTASAMKICEVKDKFIDFEVGKTGIWGEVIRQRKPLIINDFKKENPLKRGIPEGHVEISNYLSIPIFDKRKLVAVLAVANKNSDYNETDIQELTLLMGGVWDIVRKNKYEEEIIEAKEKAEESVRLKTAFLQNMSHEIRTPLNSIIGFSERITSPKITVDKRLFYTDIIVKSGFQLLSIVNDILTISAIETGQEELNKENVCINSLISLVETVFKQQLEGKMVKLKAIKPLPNAVAEILTDKTKLTQILTNLLSNAIKFTPVGEIEYGYTLKNTELEFFVKDNGIGIDKSKQKIIFERFVQADESIVVEYGGTGLGLSICKGFAELLGGKIWVESELGKGATFYFTIPYKSSKIKNCDDTLSTNQEKIKQNENKTVLVAEDHIFNYIYLEEHLKELNYKVIHAKNGKEAVEICRTNESIDFVLMDIRMPVMDGHKATMLIKEFRPNLKIIAQTAHAINIEIEKFGKAFDDYLTKPITSEKLTSILNKHLNIDK